MKASEVFLVDYTDLMAMVALAQQFRKESHSAHYVIKEGVNYKIVMTKPVDASLVVHSEE